VQDSVEILTSVDGLEFSSAASLRISLWKKDVPINHMLQNSYNNDAVFVQFDHTVDVAGNPVWRINTASATTVIHEDCSNCGVKGWGWSDNGYGLNVLGPAVVFESSGPQRLRIQVRGIDQIVLSAHVYSSVSPARPRTTPSSCLAESGELLFEGGDRLLEHPQVSRRPS
jgi:hypothetical protein